MPILAQGELGVKGIIPKLSYDPGTRAPKLRFHVPDLQRALWLHLMQSFDSGTSLRRCEWERCGIVFEAGAGTGRRGAIEKTEAEYRLRSLGLVDYPQPRLVVAMPVLFVGATNG